MPGDSSWPFFKSSFPCSCVQSCECGCIHEDVLSIPFPSSLSSAFHPAMEQHRRCQTMFPGLKVDEFCVTFISCSQSQMEILLNESSEYTYFFTNGHELLCWGVLWSRHHFLFFSFINDFFLLLVNRDKIRGSMSLNFTSVPSCIHDLIVLTIFRLN